jgi:luciferase family oxidoreductase group 1
LESLFPGRIDLGLGRAPGSDQLTAQALRRNLSSNPEEFPQDVLELMSYLAPAQAGQRVVAYPGVGTQVPIWILGSSLFGAQVAAALGLPFAFASHFAPAMMMQALEIYRARFQPSQQLNRPYVMLGFNVFAADSDGEARFLSTSMQQAFVNLRSGRPTQLPPPVEGFEEQLPPPAKAMLAEVLSCTAIGSPHTVRSALAAFIDRTKADELMITSQMFDHRARLHSYEITAEVRKTLG